MARPDNTDCSVFSRVKWITRPLVTMVHQPSLLMATKTMSKTTAATLAMKLL